MKNILEYEIWFKTGTEQIEIIYDTASGEVLGYTQGGEPLPKNLMNCVAKPENQQQIQRAVDDTIFINTIVSDDIDTTIEGSEEIPLFV